MGCRGLGAGHSLPIQTPVKAMKSKAPTILARSSRYNRRKRRALDTSRPDTKIMARTKDSPPIALMPLATDMFEVTVRGRMPDGCDQGRGPAKDPTYILISEIRLTKGREGSTLRMEKQGRTSQSPHICCRQAITRDGYQADGQTLGEGLVAQTRMWSVRSRIHDRYLHVETKGSVSNLIAPRLRLCSSTWSFGGTLAWPVRAIRSRGSAADSGRLRTWNEQYRVLFPTLSGATAVADNCQRPGLASQDGVPR